MYELIQQKRGDGTSLFIVKENGKQKNAYVGDEMTDKEVEKWLKEHNKDELKKEGSKRRTRTGK